MRQNIQTNSDNSRQPRRWKPLTQAQENALLLLLQGKSDGETAADPSVDVTRQTVWDWRNRDPRFAAELARRRDEIWRHPQDRLRSLLSKAVENIASLVETGDYDASVEVLKITGMYRGLNNTPGEGDPEKVFDAIVEQRLAQEKIPGHLDDLLIKLDDNPRKAQRKAEIEAQLWAQYGEESHE
jgi:hypothetical protein